MFPYKHFGRLRLIFSKLFCQLVRIRYFCRKYIRDMKIALISLVMTACLSAAAHNPLRGTDNGHEWVDMGTSVKWATTNVGADSPQEYGSYFAWGEIAPPTNNDYITENCRLFGNDSIGSIAGDPRYDAAQANWGGSWRMPTKDEWQELIDNCTWIRGNDYLTAIAKNGNVLHFPYAYSRSEFSQELEGDGGYYWSATPREDGEYKECMASGFMFLFADYYTINQPPSFRLMSRHDGLSVRPVLE